MSERQDPGRQDPARGGKVRRYTIRFFLEPNREQIEFRAVTPSSELMAVALATARLLRHNPEAQVSAVEVTNVETEFTVDPERDALDYWGLE